MHKVHDMEQYAVSSGLRDIPAGLKAAFTLTVLVLCLVLDSAAVSVFLIVSMAAVSVLWGKIRLGDYLKLLAVPLVFILFSGIAIAYTVRDLHQPMAVTLRALGAVSAFYFLILSTPADELLTVLGKCHVPKLILELMYLIYRYIFVLFTVRSSMSISAHSRLGYCDYPTSCRTFGNVAGNLLVLAMKRSGSCYDAMESRCYQGELRFLEKPKSLRWRQCALAVCYVCCLVGVWRCMG